MDITVVPSLLSADFADLAGAVREAEAGGARFLHFDIMDGHFVPNITFGPMVVRALRPLTKMGFLVHLMVERPEGFVEELADAGADSVTVHVEACRHLHRVIEQIKAAGMTAGVALNPATPLSAVDYVLEEIGLLLLMTVNPGFGGQQFIEGMIPKIAEARRNSSRAGREIDIAVDGGVDADTCQRIVRAGANVLIAGNSVFNNHLGIGGALRELESCAHLSEAPS